MVGRSIVNVITRHGRNVKLSCFLSSFCFSALNEGFFPFSTFWDLGLESHEQNMFHYHFETDQQTNKQHAKQGKAQEQHHVIHVVVHSRFLVSSGATVPMPRLIACCVVLPFQLVGKIYNQEAEELGHNGVGPTY